MEGKAVEDKIRRREQNPDAEVERAAAARDVTVYFNSDVSGG
jgi:cytochrome c oxidase assembly protein subunit 11